MVSPGLASKSVPMVFVFWPQNHSLGFPQFGPQNQQVRFSDLAHKTTTTVSWFEPQNQVGCGLSVAPQNQWEDEDSVGHASRSSGLLCLEPCRTRVS
jgi:hypothetical protein